MTCVKFAADKPLFLRRIANKKQGSPGWMTRKIMGCRYHGCRSGGVVPRTVKDAVPLAIFISQLVRNSQVIVVRAQYDILITQNTVRAGHISQYIFQWHRTRKR